MAARRMKGVVRPQQAPTRRKPRIQRRREGGASGVEGTSGSIAVLEGEVQSGDRPHKEEKT